MRVKSDDKHEIVKKEDIATYKESQDSQPDEMPSEQKCRIHTELSCTAFCLTCDEPVCTVCVSSDHTAHNIIDSRERLGDSSGIPRSVGFRIQKQYVTDWPSVYDIVCLNDSEDKSACLYNNDKKTVRKATLKKNSIRLHPGHILYVNKMALAPSGDRLFSLFDVSAIYVIPESTGNIQKSKYDVAPLITTTIHILKDGSVVLGARKPEPPFQLTGARQVIVMDRDGTQKMVHQFDENNQPFFTLSYRISSNTKKSLCVIDCISVDGIGRLVILKQTGELLTIYRGHRERDNEVIPFTPVALVLTGNDVIIVADDDHHMLHVLDYGGHCLKVQDTRYFEIYLPISLDMDNKGLLYVGCGTNRDMNEKAKLSILKIDGF